MHKNILTIKEAIKKVLDSKNYVFLFLFFSILMTFIYIFIPVFVVPGNDLKFFLQITPWWGFLIFILLGISVGLLIIMQVYIYKNLRRISIRGTTGGAIAGFSSVISGIFSSATCASCVSALFSFLLPTTFILKTLSYRWYISSGGFLLVLFSLFLTSKRIENECKSCKIK